MKRHVLSVLAGGLVFAASTTAVMAFYCPKLVEECRVVAGKAEMRDGSDMAKVAEAKQGCEDALKLHEQGEHKASVIKAGEAISLGGESVK